MSPIVCLLFHISQSVSNCLAFTFSSVKARVFFSALACTWPGVWRWRSVSAYVRVSAEVSKSAFLSTSHSVSPSVLTFASARGLASVFRSALTFTSPTLSPRVLAFGYVSAPPGVSISAWACNWTNASPTLLVSTLTTVSAKDLLASLCPRRPVCWLFPRCLHRLMGRIKSWSLPVLQFLRNFHWSPLCIFSENADFGWPCESCHNLAIRVLLDYWGPASSAAYDC